MSREQAITLETLPPDARDAVFTKRVQGKRRLSQWLVFLKVLARFDSFIDQAINKASRRVGKAFMALIVSIILTIVAVNVYPPAAFVGGGGIALAILCIIIFIIKGSSLKKVDLSDDFKETLLPVLVALSEDIAPKGKIMLNLNMDNPTGKQYRISKEEIPPGNNRKLVETIYEIHCCNASIPLNNGMILTLDIIKKPASYDRSYKTARGKYKSKQKWKLLTTVTAAIIPGETNLVVDTSEVSDLASREKVKLSNKKGAQHCKLSKKFKYKSPYGMPEECVSPDAIIEMFMKLCSTLNPA